MVSEMVSNSTSYMSLLILDQMTQIVSVVLVVFVILSNIAFMIIKEKCIIEVDHK